MSARSELAIGSRRELTVSVVVCLAAAGLALYAASRTWLVEIAVRPAPLSAISTPRSGGSVVPALPALALVALAGAGALPATRGRARLAVGAAVLGTGLGMAVAAGVARAGPAAASAGGAGVWPAVCIVAGAVVAVVGALTLRRGWRWPSMGTRYDRAPPQRRGDRPSDRRGGQPAPGDTPGGDPGAHVADAELWDALDRGTDPTKG